MYYKICRMHLTVYHVDHVG